MQQPMQHPLIWDVPTRLFHWTLALSFAGAWLTSGEDQWLSVHVFLGYLMLGLVVFRVIWGLVGSHYARFSSFGFGPQAALTYVRQLIAHRAARHIGHNPAGSWAIYLLLVLTGVVGLTGLFTLGGDEQQGLVAGWISFAQAQTVKQIHELAAIAMLMVVAGHIAGVLVESLMHRENLVMSMLTGTKLAEANTPITRARGGVAAVMGVLMLGFAGWWFFYALHAPLEKQLGLTQGTFKTSSVPFVGRTLADNAQWREECSSCHMAFHPSLLPSRSWVRLMAQQHDHFGSDLYLDEATTAALLTFMRANAADQHATEAAYKIEQSIQPGAAPLRMTETPYWVKKHQDITPAEWLSPAIKSRTNCAACHQDADAGTFEDGAMRLPVTSSVTSWLHAPAKR